MNTFFILSTMLTFDITCLLYCPINKAANKLERIYGCRTMDIITAAKLGCIELLEYIGISKDWNYCIDVWHGALSTVKWAVKNKVANFNTRSVDLSDINIVKYILTIIPINESFLFIVADNAYTNTLDYLYQTYAFRFENSGEVNDLEYYNDKCDLDMVKWFHRNHPDFFTYDIIEMMDNEIVGPWWDSQNGNVV